MTLVPLLSICDGYLLRTRAQHGLLQYRPGSSALQSRGMLTARTYIQCTSLSVSKPVRRPEVVDLSPPKSSSPLGSSLMALPPASHSDQRTPRRSGISPSRDG